MRTPHLPIPLIAVAALLLAQQATRLSAMAGPTNTVSATKGESPIVQPPFIEPAIPQSTFHQPRKLAEGRNPFFPQSAKHITGLDPTPNKTNVIVTPVAELTLKGISGTPEQPLAIINNRTLTIGEEADVPIGVGKIRIRCVEINMAEGTVLVQVGGQSRQLRLPTK